MSSTNASAEEKYGSSELMDMDFEALLLVKIGPSSDASKDGLSPIYYGGQVATGGRNGFLGTRDMMDSPYSVNSYTQDFIKNRHAASLGDVVQYDPSVRLARGFGNFQQTYIIRGLPLFSDDMLYNGLYGMLPRQYLASELIERVEVLRGSNAFLNGAAPGVSGALGGSVNVMPKRAPKDDLTRFTAGFASDAQALVAVDLGRRYYGDRIGLRFNAVNRDGDTAVDGESRRLSMVTIGADYRGESLRVSADLGFQDNRMNATSPSITIAEGLVVPAAFDAAINIAQPWTYSNEKSLFGTLRAEYDFSDDVTMWIAGGARKGKEDSVLTPFIAVNNSRGDFSFNRFDVVHEDSVKTGEIGFRWDVDSDRFQNQFTFSVNAFQNKNSNAFIFYSSAANNLYQFDFIEPSADAIFVRGKLGSPLVTEKVQHLSMAIADEIAMMDERLLFVFGARHQRIKNDTFDYDTGQEESFYDEGLWTPSLGIVYNISPDVSVYVNFIEGLLKGDVAPAINQNGSVSNAGAALEPYSSRQTEIGMKYNFGTLGVGIGLFEIRKPVSGFNSENAFIINNYDQYRGLELTLFGEVKPGIRVLGGASLLNSSIGGNDAIGAPKTLANLGIEWDIPKFPSLTFTSNAIYTGPQYLNTSNSQEVPSWSRLDFGLRYQKNIADKKQLIVRIQVENVTNHSYWMSAGGFPGFGYLTIGRPATLSINSTVSF